MFSKFWLKLTKQLRIRNKGKGNIIRLPSKYNCRNMMISIQGQNNRVEIDEDFYCRGKAAIRIIGNGNVVKIGKGFNCRGNTSFVVYAEAGTLILGDGISIESELVIKNNDNKKNARISIGSKTTFYKTEITCFEENSSVTIGEDCMFSFDTFVFNTDKHRIFDCTTKQHLNPAKDIVIDDHVWVGWGVVILKNVHIAADNIIGRGAVVAKSFSCHNCAIAGNPAKICKENIYWER